jgi:thiol:disulfide interchange protein DsbA
MADMKRKISGLLCLLLLPVVASAQLLWQEGRHYTLLKPAAPVSTPAGKIEVTEIFSYGCIYCFRAKGEMQKLKDGLPADAVMTYVHAAFVPSEGWPMLQRAFYTAQSLGIAEATHDQMFTSIWETGEMPLLDGKGGRMRNPLPTLADAARFYQKYSLVKPETFLKLATSKEIDAAVAHAEELIKLYKVPGTPAVVVNGRYLVNNDTLTSSVEQRQLVDFLIGLERRRLGLPTPPKR